jgi:hypothetical protein
MEGFIERELMMARHRFVPSFSALLHYHLSVKKSESQKTLQSYYG